MVFTKNPLITFAIAFKGISPSHRKIEITGSNAIYGTVPFREIPQEELPMTEDVDLILIDDPIFDGWIFEYFSWATDFYKENGFYIDPVSPNTSILPVGWENRRVLLENDLDMEILCIDLYDSCASKLAANRPQDISYVHVLLKTGIVDKDLLVKRVGLFDDQDFKSYDNGFGAKTNKQRILSLLRNWVY
jgi:hypothetical protein